MKDKNFYVAILSVVILLMISIIIRIPKNTETYKNNDATYHTLLTMKCYDETPISVHKFLPIVSLGDEEDKNISWGACVKDASDNYYYTSFSPVGFVLPYIFVNIFNLPINIYSLYAFNSVICIVTLILMTILFCKLFSKYISKNWIVLFTALIYLFQIEVMHSQGVIYWVQSIFQLLITIQLILFLNFKKRKAKICFFTMCLIMPYVEWTGYVSNVAFAIIIFIQRIIENKKITIKAFTEPVIIGIMTILSFGMFTGHFLLNIDFNQYIVALKSRFFARSLTTKNVQIFNLLKEYIVSYKYMIVLNILNYILIVSVREYRRKLWQLIKEYKYIIFFFVFILLENIIMLNHAILYTFDRLKFTYILLTLFYIGISTIYNCKTTRKRAFLFLVTSILIAIATANMIEYKIGYGQYITECKYELNNQMIAQYIKEKFNYSNSILCSNSSVRGYLNLLFDRGIYEEQGYDMAYELALQHNKQYLVYIEKELTNVTMDQIIVKEVRVFNLQDNSEHKIYIENNKLVITE